MHKLYRTTQEEHTDPVEGTITVSIDVGHDVETIKCYSNLTYVDVDFELGAKSVNAKCVLEKRNIEKHGVIPDWMCGSLYRNGPYSDKAGTTPLLQRFHIENQRVTYQTRYLHTDMTQRSRGHFNVDETSVNTIVSFFPLQDELYSTTMSTNIHRIDPNTLDTLEKVDLSQYVPVNSTSAHPHVDSDGTVHSIGQSCTGGTAICIFKIPPTKGSTTLFPKGDVVSTIKTSTQRSLNYVHAFLMTDNFYIYVEQPLYLNRARTLAAKMHGDVFMPALDFKPSINARFRVIDRGTGQEVNQKFKYEAAPLSVFHHINAYEENGYVIFDLCGYKTDASMHYVYLKSRMSGDSEAKWRNIEEPEPRRYVIPLNVSQLTPINENLVSSSFSTATSVRRNEDTLFCTWETLADTGFEFSSINYNHYNGKKYRYSYGVGWHSKGKPFHTVCKINAETRTFVEWAEDHCYPSEPTFVANPNPESEDDGVLLSAVNSVNSDADMKAFLLILDAQTLTEIARVEFKDVQDFGRDFHGMFRGTKRRYRTTISVRANLDKDQRDVIESSWC